MAIPKREAAGKQHDSIASFEAGLDRALDAAIKDPESVAGAHATTTGNPVNLGPRVAEASAWSAKQLANTANAGERWLAGVTAPRKNPIEAAKASAVKWANQLRAAIEAGAYAAGLGKVNLDEMYETIRAGGSAPFTSGVQRRTAKVNRVVDELRPLVAALAVELDRMPTDTDGQREAKMIAAKRGMQAIGKKRKGLK